MKDIWVTSDTHFGHSNILEYGPRPFNNIHQHDQELLENWNSVVKPGDRVYHLGDVYMGCAGGYAWELLKRLHGKKHLLLGNHDDGKDAVLHKWFYKIGLWRTFGDEGLIFSHIPLHSSNLQTRKKKAILNVHGHIHGNPSPSNQYMNVCVEWTQYRPIHFDELLQRQRNYENERST